MVEKPDIDVEDNIASFVNLVLSCLFYAPILPVALPIALFGIILNFYITKYALVNHYHMPEEFGQ